MTEMTADKATALRKPFPRESIGRLPKPYKKDSPKGQCNECGGYHGLPAVHLDYVGHAATTDRLLTVDPGWTWEPMALDQFGSPQCDRDGNLWIRLTVCGVTRLGVGDGSSMKERIGDAIRNAAMRFGVALDLWAKEDLVEFAQAARAHEPQPSASAPAASQPAPESPLLDTKGRLARRMFKLFGDAGIADRDLRLQFVSETVGRVVSGSGEMTDDDARAVCDRLEELIGHPVPEEEPA
jgi:hypothetical protein